MQPAVQTRLIRAPNASALTGSGTNTWLVGHGDVAVIDPGPDLDAHLAAILHALGPDERISHILITHPHLDHSALAPRLSDRVKAPVYGFGSATDGRSALMAALAGTGLPDGGEGLDRAFRPDIRLADNECLTAGSWTLRALHTPGHLGAHLCFAAEDVLFSGDHVMGWSTSIVAPPDGDMSDYMASLHRLAAEPWALMLPGHGDAIDAPARRLQTLIDHRTGREAQIRAALQDSPADAATLTSRLYADIPTKLHTAARANVLAHLIDLQRKGLVVSEKPVTATSIFRAI